MKKLLIVLALCAIAMTYIFTGKASKEAVAADTDADIKASYQICEEAEEDIWYEYIDDAVSEKADEYEEAGTAYTISEENDIDDGYFITINTADESTVIAGEYIDGSYYIIKLESAAAIDAETAENAIYDYLAEIL